MAVRRLFTIGRSRPALDAACHWHYLVLAHLRLGDTLAFAALVAGPASRLRGTPPPLRCLDWLGYLCEPTGEPIEVALQGQRRADRRCWLYFFAKPRCHAAGVLGDARHRVRPASNPQRDID